MDDLISRQAAIDVISRISDHGNSDRANALGLAESKIKALPTAEPELILCKDCKWFGEIGCAIGVVDDTDKPTENDYCSYAERRTDGSD